MIDFENLSTTSPARKTMFPQYFPSSHADCGHATQLEPTYCPDIAAEIDREDEIIADELGVSINQARKIIEYRDTLIKRNQSETLAKAIGLILGCQNHSAMVHAIAFAFGMNELNGKRNQAQVAKELGCTRSLISHYTTGAADLFAGKVDRFDCTRYRKSNESRAKFQKAATDPFTKAKANAIKKLKQSTKNN